MIPYIVFTILLLVFRYFEKPFLIFLTLLLFSTIRYDVGWDFMNYYSYAELWGSDTVSWERYSFIWSWLFQTANTLNQPHIIIAVPAFFTLSILYYVINKVQVNPALVSDTMLVYAFWPYFYLASFSTIRQALAVAVGLLILYSAIKKRALVFFLLIILDYYIHPSSIVCIAFALFFLPNFKLSYSQLIMVIIVGVIVASYIGVVFSRTALAQYLFYLEESDTYGSRLALLLGFILLPVLLLKFKKVDLSIVSIHGILDLVIITLVLTIFIYLGLSNSIISRGMGYFSILLIFVAPFFVDLFSDRRLGYVLVMASFIGVFFYYLVSTSDAYSLGLATSSFVPYKTILFK